MNACRPERLVHVDVAQAGHDGLIQEQCFHERRAPSELFRQVVCGEGRSQWLGPEPGVQRRNLRCIQYPDLAESAMVAKSNLPPIVEGEREVKVGVWRVS